MNDRKKITLVETINADVVEDATMEVSEKRPGAIKVWVKRNWKTVLAAFVTGIAAGFGLGELCRSDDETDYVDGAIEESYEIEMEDEE